MNLLELRTRCLDKLDENSTGLRWTTDDLNGYLNLAYQTMCVKTGTLVKTSPIIAVANQFAYDIPTDCVTPLRLYRDNPLEKVWPTASRRLDEEQRNWRSQTGTRWEWYFVFGLDKLMIGPTFTTGGEAYTLTYNADPGLDYLVYNNDEPDMPRRYHASLVDYAVARALLPDADEGRLMYIGQSIQDFESAVVRLRKESQKTSGRQHTMRAEDPDGRDWGVFT